MSEAPVPPSLCLLPWLNLSLDVDGSARPCCRYEHQQPSSEYQFANLADTGLAEVWNSAEMQRLRADFAAGERPAGCRACWDEEAAGVPSFRQTFLDDRRIRARPDLDDLAPAAPAALDLKLSNACNLKCRICGPVASSLWLNEELKVLGPDHGDRAFLEANKDYFRANKITERSDDLATLRRWVEHLESIEMTGGEPMLSKENRQVIELITEHGDPSSVALTFTTNATVMDERILSALPRFGEVTIALSIDDVGERLEHQRAPLRWTEVEANIDRYAELASDTVHVFTNTTISTLNAWYLPEFLTWIYGRYDGRIEPHVNLVHDPRHFCIQVAPPRVKEVLRDRLLAAAEGPWPTHVQDKARGAADFLVSAEEPDEEQWWRGIAELRRRDEIRGESYAAAHPEWHAQLEALGCWERTIDAPRRRKVLAWLRG